MGLAPQHLQIHPIKEIQATRQARPIKAVVRAKKTLVLFRTRVNRGKARQACDLSQELRVLADWMRRRRRRVKPKPKAAPSKGRGAGTLMASTMS